MRTLRLLAVSALLLCLAPSAARATMVTFELGPASFGGAVARVPVNMAFTPMAGEEIVVITVDVSASSINITDSGLDFSRFSFDLSMSDLPASWSVAADFTGLFSTALLDTPVMGGDPLGGGNYHIGDIIVELAGIAPGTMIQVAIDALDLLGLPATNALTPDVQDVIEVVFVDGGEQMIIVPEQQDAGVPEPASFALGVLGLVALARRRRQVTA